MFLGGVGTKCDKQVQMHRCEPRGVGLRARGVWGPIPQASKQARENQISRDFSRKELRGCSSTGCCSCVPATTLLQPGCFATAISRYSYDFRALTPRCLLLLMGFLEGITILSRGRRKRGCHAVFVFRLSIPPQQEGAENTEFLSLLVVGGVLSEPKESLNRASTKEPTHIQHVHLADLAL